ncbi:hypothetical protein CIG75_16620 [Tumebacillus algifaecis]|uniref:Uncharacterized protein n=1 Tax=Tumebacillus algifaecis TaxID=1214604 RepID=A0A223D474_9BACL|nr:hypothetical protein [Tumebacillus algifaecis]ASS76419.1 hypothetical protein CIG75_16620 [Tumebacillus algifaecis]
MNVLLIVSIVALPLFLFFLRKHRLAWLFDLLSVIATWLFLITTGLSILEIKRMGVEFTTHIHEIFNNWLFLSTSGYLGVYSVYRLLITTVRARKNRPSP